MKYLKNVLVALAFVFAFGAAYATSSSALVQGFYRTINEGTNFPCTPSIKCEEGGQDQCTVFGGAKKVWKLDAQGKCTIPLFRP